MHLTLNELLEIINANPNKSGFLSINNFRKNKNKIEFQSVDNFKKDTSEAPLLKANINPSQKFELVINGFLSQLSKFKSNNKPSSTVDRFITDIQHLCYSLYQKYEYISPKYLEVIHKNKKNIESKKLNLLSTENSLKDLRKSQTFVSKILNVFNNTINTKQIDIHQLQKEIKSYELEIIEPPFSFNTFKFLLQLPFHNQDILSKMFDDLENYLVYINNNNNFDYTQQEQIKELYKYLTENNYYKQTSLYFKSTLLYNLNESFPSNVLVEEINQRKTTCLKLKSILDKYSDIFFENIKKEESVSFLLSNHIILNEEDKRKAGIIYENQKMLFVEKSLDEHNIPYIHVIPKYNVFEDHSDGNIYTSDYDMLLINNCTIFFHQYLPLLSNILLEEDYLNLRKEQLHNIQLNYNTFYLFEDEQLADLFRFPLNILKDKNIEENKSLILEYFDNVVSLIKSQEIPLDIGTTDAIHNKYLNEFTHVILNQRRYKNLIDTLSLDSSTENNKNKKHKL